MAKKKECELCKHWRERCEEYEKVLIDLQKDIPDMQGVWDDLVNKGRSLYHLYDTPAETKIIGLKKIAESEELEKGIEKQSKWVEFINKIKRKFNG